MSNACDDKDRCDAKGCCMGWKDESTRILSPWIHMLSFVREELVDF